MKEQIDYTGTLLHWLELARASNVILGLGLFSLFILSYSVSTFVSDLVFPGLPLSKFGADKQRKNVWAVVTGASDGIGAEYATQLAQAGFNIVLVSRTQSKLDAIAKELEEKYKVATKTLSMDASKAEDADYENFANLIKDIDVGVLVNNVGQSHEIPVPFHATEVSELQAIIDINVTCTLRTTQTVLPKLMQRRSLILTMGSFGGYLPTPLLATYSGSKAFLQTWSTALASELADSKVTVKLVNSYLVTSKMSKIRKPTMTIPTPKIFVRSVLKGIKSGPVITPFWAHGLMAFALSWIGRESSVVVSGNKSMHLAIRKRALRKREKAQKAQ
jgi:17beta-estradiol 17-dehydrogenase / very-long-chain 3-oxoacyl-CoA reductase